MSPEELIAGLFEIVTEHLRPPAGYGWAPMAGMGVLAVFGLMLLLRGARWAPGLGAVTFLAIGAAVGAGLSNIIATPLWPTVGVVGVLGFVLGLTMFRFWQAVLLAACFIIAGFSVYFVRELTPEVQNWMAASTEPGVITLPVAGTVVGEDSPTALAEVRSLWDHLNKTVPSFQATATTLVLATGLAGLIFGLLMPRASRALWAASIGTVLFGVGLTGLLKQFAPDALDWLLADKMRAWGIVGAIWVISLAINLVTCRTRKSAKKKSDEDEDESNVKPALA